MLEQLEESAQRNPDSRITIIRDNRKMVMKLDDFLVQIDVSAYPGRTPNVSLDEFGPWLHQQLMRVAEMYKQGGTRS